MHRTLGIVLVVFALTAGCGDDEEDTPTTIPTTTPTSASPAPSTTVPATVARGVVDGAVCSPPGARGTTQAGLALVCTQIAGGSETRWRPA